MCGADDTQNYCGIKRIAIVGFRAVGKTSVAKELANLLGWTFVDLDELFVRRSGMTISRWVSLHGWNSFRNRESELLRESSNLHHVVVATGGGIVERNSNIALLKERFFVVWLSADIETIRQRMGGDEMTATNRPPLGGKDSFSEIPRLLAKRIPLYGEVSHLSVATENSSPSEIARRIYKYLKNTFYV